MRASTHSGCVAAKSSATCPGVWRGYAWGGRRGVEGLRLGRLAWRWELCGLLGRGRGRGRASAGRRARASASAGARARVSAGGHRGWRPGAAPRRPGSPLARPPSRRPAASCRRHTWLGLGLGSVLAAQLLLVEGVPVYAGVLLLQAFHRRHAYYYSCCVRRAYWCSRMRSHGFAPVSSMALRKVRVRG